MHWPIIDYLDIYSVKESNPRPVAQQSNFQPLRQMCRQLCIMRYLIYETMRETLYGM